MFKTSEAPSIDLNILMDEWDEFSGKRNSKQRMLDGAHNSGNAAHRNKTGMWALSKKQQIDNARRGGEILKYLIENFPEYRQLHYDKIRYGRAKKKFNRLTYGD